MNLLRRAPSPLRGSAIIAPNRIGRGPLPNPATGASGPTQGGTATAPSAHACWPRVSRGRGGDDSRRLRSCVPPVRSDEPWWLEPYPDVLLGDVTLGPEA